jgi:hypothetical protein
MGRREVPAQSEASANPSGRLQDYFDGYTEGPGVWKWRHYLPIYERHFAKFVGRAPSIVEIGIFSGGSLQMWLDYFGEGTHVHGVDIEPACKTYEREGVKISIGDQSDPAFWKRFLADAPSIDIVIDDGSHEASDQITTLEALLPKVNPGGVYVTEDSHGTEQGFHAYMDRFSRQLHAMAPGDPEQGIETTAFQQYIESIHQYPWMTVIEKRSVPFDRFTWAKKGTEWQPFYEGEYDFSGDS